MSQPDTARLLIACDDQPGIVAAVAGVLAQHGANIISLDQHSTDSEGGRFFQRTVIHLDIHGRHARVPSCRGAR
nr:ACT domain-containing protein [Microbacterium sp. BF1]